METVKIPAGDSHDDALIEELKNPQESAAYLTALFEEEVSEPELFYHIQQMKILQAIGQGFKSTHEIAEKTGLEQHLVNYYLEWFKKNGYLIAHRESQSGENNFDSLILKDKGKVAIEDIDDLLDPTLTPKYDLRGAQIGGFAETVNGNQISTQHNYAPEQKQTLVEAAKEIQQHESSDLETAQKQVAEDLATKAKANVTILGKLMNWKKSLCDPVGWALPIFMISSPATSALYNVGVRK